MKKILSVLQISIFVFSAQIGSGLFLLPSLLNKGGYNSIFALFIIGLFATVLAHIFAQTGTSIRNIINEGFGEVVSKISYFIYWFISWFSTIVLFKEFSGYLNLSSEISLMIEIFIWLIITSLNMWKIKYTVYVESILTILKFFPFILLIISFFISEKKEIITQENLNISMFMKCMWCFIGVETGNVIGHNLKLSDKEKKLGIYIGTFSVLIFYISNIFLSFSIIDNTKLEGCRMPYILILEEGFKSLINKNYIKNIVTTLILITLIGSINSWTVSSGYVTSECAETKILPKIFAKKNIYGVPYFGIFFSSFLVLICLLTTAKYKNSYSLISNSIDFSCYFFLFIYSLSTISFAKRWCKNKIASIFYYLIGLLFLIIFLFEIVKFIKT